MALIDRAKNIILTPKTEWDVVAAESMAPAQLVTGYVLPLAAAYALAGLIGTALVLSFFGGFGGLGIALAFAVFHLVMAVVSVFVLGFIIDALAPTFAGTKNFNQAVKVAAYSHTPIWVFGLLTIIPFLGWLAILIGALYALYLLYLGLPKLMQSPSEKAVPYVVVVVVCAIVLYFVVSMIAGMAGGMGMMGMAARHAATAPAVVATQDARLQKLEEFGKKMEEANKRMEAAGKSGDPNKQMEAALSAMGTALSGGKGVEPLQLDQLKPLVPEKVGDLPRTDMRTDRGGPQGFVVAKAEGIYSDNAGKRVALEVTDTGGMAGLMGLAGWMNVQGEHEDANRREVTRKEGGRYVHEQVSKTGGSNEYTVVIGERFVVTAKGTLDIGALKSAVNAIDLGKLEALSAATAKG